MPVTAVALACLITATLTRVAAFAVGIVLIVPAFVLLGRRWSAGMCWQG